MANNNITGSVSTELLQKQSDGVLSLSEIPDLETLDCKGLHHVTSLKELSISDGLNLENITDANSLASIANICIGKRCFED
ncbi:hypothetical protein PIB30_067409 [Stylosanthes scabra]|uniref:Uncharacterized protein n=1 Tax=Stylosanthes scabra TaxID=79078 RepID=A0ABU6WKY8_9FABA|nr:hypothetical protein [Stylosanthes scabra]